MMADHHEHQTIVIPMEDDLIHTQQHPFCSIDPACPCHGDRSLLEELNDAVEAGLLTTEEATRTAQGLTL